MNSFLNYFSCLLLLFRLFDFLLLLILNPCLSLANPVLDAWLGARKWARLLNSNLQSVSVTREEYDEKGGEYLKEHFASNRYVSTPPQS